MPCFTLLNSLPTGRMLQFFDKSAQLHSLSRGDREKIYSREREREREMNRQICRRHVSIHVCTQIHREGEKEREA